MSRQRYWIAAAICLSVLLVWLAFFWEPDIGAPAGHPGAGTPRPAGQLTGGDFTLDSPGGELALQDHRGKVVLLYFGYTFCPDVCPTSLSALGQAFTALTPEELAQFIFAATEVQTLQKFKSLVEAIPAEMEKQRDIVVTIPDLPKKKRTPRKKAGKENERKTSG